MSNSDSHLHHYLWQYPHHPDPDNHPDTPDYNGRLFLSGSPGGSHRQHILSLQPVQPVRTHRPLPGLQVRTYHISSVKSSRVLEVTSSACPCSFFIFKVQIILSSSLFMAQYFIKQNPNCINIEHHDPPMILTFHSRFVETEASVCEDSSSAWRRSSVPLLDSWDTRSVLEIVMCIMYHVTR